MTNHGNFKITMPDNLVGEEELNLQLIAQLKNEGVIQTNSK